MQDGFVQLMQTLAPDLAAEMAQRALVLERVDALAPVGRRQLAARLSLTEREIRSASTLLKDLQNELEKNGFLSRIAAATAEEAAEQNATIIPTDHQRKRRKAGEKA